MGSEEEAQRKKGWRMKEKGERKREKCGEGEDRRFAREKEKG